MKVRHMGIPQKKSCEEDTTSENSSLYDDSHVSISFDAGSNIIRIDGTIGGEDGLIFEDVVTMLKEYIPTDEEGNELQENPEPLTKLELHINSDGGSVDAALNIISQIEQLKKEGVEVVSFVKEKACSMAFLISIICSKRIMRKYAKLMLHPSWLSVYGETALTISVLHEFVDDTNKNWEVFKEIVLEYTDMDEKLLAKIYKNGEDFYMNSKEALKYKCVDEIL